MTSWFSVFDSSVFTYWHIIVLCCLQNNYDGEKDLSIGLRANMFIQVRCRWHCRTPVMKFCLVVNELVVNWIVYITAIYKKPSYC